VSPDAARRASDVPLPGGDFRLFVTRLSFQGMIALGVLENPLTRTKEPNLGNARMLIDDLAMLREKTEGNLELEERELLDQVIENLRAVLAKR
jgi:Domain of unknown function (DUF1844)